MASSIFAGDSGGSPIIDSLTIDGQLGPEQLTNPGFTGNSTGWTLGTGWAYSANTVVHTAGNTATLAQNPAGVTAIVAGTLYRVEMQQSAGTAGEVGFTLGGTTLSGGFEGGAGAESRIEYIRATTSAGFIGTPTSDYDGTLTLVSVKEWPDALTLTHPSVAGAAHIYASADEAGNVIQIALETSNGQSLLIHTEGARIAGDMSASGTLSADGNVWGQGYLSGDESPGVTAGPFTVITGITVKNGLVTALTGS